jgi:steroid 5-alpha reductase family enzyme
MSATSLWLQSLLPMLLLGMVAWVVATARRNVGLVDIFWSLFFLAGALLCAVLTGALDVRARLLLVLIITWSLRLAAHLALRNWSAPEDHRYRAIRARNSPGFEWKSLYLVFGLQAVLAWLVFAPLAWAIGSATPLGLMGLLGAALALFGIGFESLADAQLARFRAAPGTAGTVLDRGLWRYSRHPNYFGEFCFWWGCYVLAADAGAWWTVFSPLLMSVLLLRVSGVTLLEKDIGERRPAYRDYIAHTNAFFPGPAKRS